MGTRVERPPGNHAVQRALRLLDRVAQGPGPLTLSDLARELGLPKSSAHSLLRALLGAGFLEGDARGGYRVGLHAFEIGAAYLRGMDPVTAARPDLVRLRDELGMTAHFAVLDGRDAVYLAKEDPAALGPSLASALGARLPAAATAVGKAQLAHRPEGPLGDAESDFAGGRLDRELEEARRRGFAVDAGETKPGIGCVAAPVFDADGRCCGAIGVSYLVAGGPAAGALGPQVVAAARRTSARLGHGSGR